MAWLYIPLNFAPASECSEKAGQPHSDYSASSTEPFATWSGKPLQPGNLPRLWKRERSIQRLSGLTFSPSTATACAARWIASLPDSLARTSPSLVGVPAWMASARDSSSTSWTSRTIAVRGSSLWRTSAPSLLPPPPLWTKKKASSTKEQPPASWENWPTAGGTRNGSLFPRPMWEPATGGQGGSALHGEGWMTPKANDAEKRGNVALRACAPELVGQAQQWLTPNVPNGGRSVSAALVESKGTTEDGDKRTVGLESQSKHWATPNAHDGRRPGADLKSTQGMNLSRDAAVWPSPRATDGSKGGPNQAGSKGDLMLPSAAAQWPTPAARDGKGANSTEHVTVTGGGRKHMDQLANFVEHSPSSPLAQPTPHGQESLQSAPTSPRRLNPAFGCWLMGWPVWWTNPAVTSCARSAMESYRSRLDSHLSSLLAERGSSLRVSN